MSKMTLIKGSDRIAWNFIETVRKTYFLLPLA
jgi:hypothetical protein